jgi:hypothetical protein
MERRYLALHFWSVWARRGPNAAASYRRPAMKRLIFFIGFYRGGDSVHDSHSVGAALSVRSFGAE